MEQLNVTHRLIPATVPFGIIFLSLLASLVPAADWPQFRGPGGEGHATAHDLPLTWSESENIRWKVPVAGLGWSSPVIQGEQIWLTAAREEGKSLHALCIDRASGSLLHDVAVLQRSEPGQIHTKNSHASPTPLLEGDRVYVHFGAHGTACLTSGGQIIWKTEPWQYNHRHGPAGSPVLYEDLLIFNCDGTDVQFVVALDKNTGKVRWKVDREGPMAYATPLVIHANGADQLVSPGGNQIVSYNPLTGQELWRYRYTGYSVVPRPVQGFGMVFFSCGFNDAVMYAVRLDGEGDVTETHGAWQQERGAPHTPSPLLVGEELYLVSDKGIASCLDAATGKQHWQQRIGGNFSASPLFADGRIYLLSEEGTTTIFAPGRTFQELAQNTIDGRALASLAAVDRSIYLRSDTHLYRIEKH
jgi:outer membrane protein assembly factor BamB